jgi:signal transduction histidine kinase
VVGAARAPDSEIARHAPGWTATGEGAAGGVWQHDNWGRSDRRRRRRRGGGFGLAILVGLIQVLGTRAAASGQHDAAALDAWAYTLLMAGPVVLLVRRPVPMLTLAVSLTATVAYALSNYPDGPSFVAVVVALFAAVRTGRRRITWSLTAVAYLAYVGLGRALDLLGSPFDAFDAFGGFSVNKPTLSQSVAVAAWLLVVLALAEAVRVRAEHFAEMSRFRAEQNRTRAEQQRRQASEERLRMARELHDVLGHHLSLINVQAGVGLHLMDVQPEQARAALTAIKSASAEALREVRSVLGVLRPQEEAAPRAPAPGLDAVGDLTAEAGFTVRTDILGSPRALPAEVDRAAYRIVQEALTNVRRHAGAGATATVTLEYDEGELTVRVDDDGPGAAAGSDDAAGAASPARTDRADSDGGGNGIVGMRERVAALGGELTTGPRPGGGGFRVWARMPLAQPQPSPAAKPSAATEPPPAATEPPPAATEPPPAAKPAASLRLDAGKVDW